MSVAANPLHAALDGALEKMLELRPEWASDIGDHRFDDRLDDHSDAAAATEVAVLQGIATDLAAWAPPADVDDAVDVGLLQDAVAARLFALTELPDRQHDPLLHLPGRALHAIVSREFAPARVRLLSLRHRLAAIPASLDVGRRVLGELSEVHRDTAVDQTTGVIALIDAELPALLAADESQRAQAQSAAAQAVSALEQFRSWLAGQPARRDPRLGKELWSAKLAHTLDTDQDPAELLAGAWGDLTQMTIRLQDEAAEYLGEKAGSDCAARAFDQLGQDVPDDATIVALAAQELLRATEFVRERAFVTVPDDPVRVVTMPEFARGVAVAYCDPPGALETAELPTFYAIAPTPNSWSDQRRASFYREYNTHQLTTLTVHEAMPGHALQLAHARRHARSAPHRVRAAFRSGTFVEGWAVHAEEVMAGMGFGGLPGRLMQRKMALRMTLNTILDHGVHCAGMTEAEAMALMIGRGYQQEGEAAGKWRRALLTSTQLSTYHVGWREVSALAHEHLAAGGTYDEFLAHGNLAPRRLRRLLFPPQPPPPPC